MVDDETTKPAQEKGQEETSNFFVFIHCKNLQKYFYKGILSQNHHNVNKKIYFFFTKNIDRKKSVLYSGGYLRLGDFIDCVLQFFLIIHKKAIDVFLPTSVKGAFADIVF